MQSLRTTVEGSDWITAASQSELFLQLLRNVPDDIPLNEKIEAFQRAQDLVREHAVRAADARETLRAEAKLLQKGRKAISAYR